VPLADPEFAATSKNFHLIKGDRDGMHIAQSIVGLYGIRVIMIVEAPPSENIIHGLADIYTVPYIIYVISIEKKSIQSLDIKKKDIVTIRSHSLTHSPDTHTSRSNTFAVQTEIF
jgi:hypothetical protein